MSLRYVTTYYYTKEKIELDSVPSNLGTGKVPYFVCSETSNRCRVLYKAYGSEIWKSREAYDRAIFYESQTSSKYSKFNDEYWRLEKEIERLRTEKRWQKYYKGKETRRYKRYLQLIERHRMADYLRWEPENLPLAIRQIAKDYGFCD